MDYIKIDNDNTVSISGEVFFLTHKHKDGHYMGFYSHSPWGNVRDQEQGWVVLSPELEEVGRIETRTSGICSGLGWAKWVAIQIDIHGPRKKLYDEFGNQWRITVDV